jgi:hypothetical protein
VISPAGLDDKIESDRDDNVYVTTLVVLLELASEILTELGAHFKWRPFHNTLHRGMPHHDFHLIRPQK